MRPHALARAMLLAGVAWLLAHALARMGAVDDLLRAVERRSMDYRMAWYRGARLPPGAAPSGIVVVAVDEPSIRELGRFPLWPRAYHAQLLERLTAAGARVVAFDLLFAEADTLPEAVRRLRAEEIAGSAGIDAARASEVLAAWGGDAGFAARMRAHGRVVIAADPLSGAMPIGILAASAMAVGHVSAAPDPDGVLRRIVTERGDPAPLPALGIAAAQALSPDVVTPREGRVLLDFLGPRGSFLTLSYADVLAGRVAPALLHDRLVFVGATAAGLGDVFATPFSEDMPGVEAHATLALQLLSGRTLRPASAAASAATEIALVSAATCAVILAPAAVALLLAPAAASVHVVVAFEAFVQRGIEVPFAFPLAAWTLAALLAAAWRYAAEERHRRHIQRAFGRYVAPDVVAEIARRPGSLRLGGESRDVTVAFVDIRGFTALAHALDAEALARFLHAFFTAVEEEIHSRRGTVDKYIGDAVMMLFGAPNQLEDAPLRACEAALGIVETVRRRAEEWRTLGVPELSVGIGIESGVAVVGNLGSERRFDYTALGDVVNVAARLQEMNKELGTTILVGPGTRARVGDALPFRTVGTRPLRGRAGALAIHELPCPGASPPSASSSRTAAGATHA